MSAALPAAPLARSLRERVPPPLKAPLRPAKWAYRRATTAQRVLPDALIIGAAKSGTTALFAYLRANPAILPAQEKEVHFFDLNYHRGPDWYRAYFPTRRQLADVADRIGVEPVACEGTPYYLAHPLVPYRVRGLLPSVKLIALLRNPVDRAVSHYHHNVEIGFESLTLEEALEREEERLDGQAERIAREPLHRSFEHQHHGYLARGHYCDQLETWFTLFGRERVLVLDAKHFFTDPAATVERVCSFLGVPSHQLPDYRPVGKRSYPAIDPAVAERLRQHFDPHNERLWPLLGERFSWG